MGFSFNEFTLAILFVMALFLFVFLFALLFAFLHRRLVGILPWCCVVLVCFKYINY